MKAKQPTSKKISIHLLLWFFFIILPPLSVLPAIKLDQPDELRFVITISLVSSVLMIGIFYTNYLLLFPKLFIQKHRLRYFASLLGLFGLSIAIVRVFRTIYFDFPIQHSREFIYYFFGFAIFRLVLVVFVSSSLVVYERWQLALKARMLAENAFLRAQINPHFLFNTLNGIYSLVVQKHESAPGTIERLSSLMRYVASDVQQAEVPLEKEIDYIKDFIELQGLRLTDNVKVSFASQGDFSSVNITPFLLITFVENAFKYGVSTEKKCAITIDAKLDGTVFNFTITNHKIQQIRNVPSDGIGLKNVIQRIETEYGGAQKLQILDSNDVFTVHLTIDLA